MPYQPIEDYGVIGDLHTVALVFLLGAAFIGISFHDYQTLRKSLAANQSAALTIDQQREEIAQQRLQIQSFEHNAHKLYLILLLFFDSCVIAPELIIWLNNESIG